jgi:hypothetical protein
VYLNQRSCTVFIISDAGARVLPSAVRGPGMHGDNTAGRGVTEGE